VNNTGNRETVRLLTTLMPGILVSQNEDVDIWFLARRRES
jgi:hypothetical protein